MCGIVGFKSKDGFRNLMEALPAASEHLSHRGPDDSGFVYDEAAGVGMAHRRLSIIDLSSAGHQPMKSDDGKVCICYNGEIYNFREIRKILEARGHRFNSATDTEVVLKAYLQWGTECLAKFIGMFAFAIWDSHQQTLFLARDRLGIKPLYYYLTPEQATLIFASELKAIMRFQDFGREIDYDALPLFLHYQYIPAPKTIFKNTYKLLPGHYLIFEGDHVRTEEYWKFPDTLPDRSISGPDEEECLQRLDDLLTTAVSDRLISDVPLGALLSGGIDSSVVVALMQKISSKPTRTFSIGFKEQGYNEAPWAARVARHLETEHTELYVSADDALGVIPRLPDFYDEPFADASAIPTFLVSLLTRQQVTVALSGDGGDEQFCGYVRYWTTKSMANGFNRFPLPVKRAMARILGFIPPTWVANCYLPLHNFLPQRFRMANFPDKWQKLLKLMAQTRISDLYRMTVCHWSDSEVSKLVGRELPYSMFEQIFKETADWPLLSRLMRVDQKTYLPDAMLTKVDRASMANSLEIRVPLIDHRVVEFTAGLPEHFKYRNGTGKYLLKRLLSRYLPVNLFERPKMGFGVPIDRWLRSELKDLLLDYLSTERIKGEGLFDSRFIEKKIKEHLSGQVNHQYRLWSLLMWQMWRERWLGA
jgi:asparagine synthase (glutamine-hydrolysing)